MRKRVPRRCGAGRLLLVLASLLLPLGAMLSMPRQGLADQAGQDTLWAVTSSKVSACQSPAASASLSGCFASAANQVVGDISRHLATDGVNVYIAGGSPAYGLSCPIADLGANCTEIMAGPWGGSQGTTSVLALAAADGALWIGQNDGMIYKCPSNLPFSAQQKPPSQCVALDDAGNRAVVSLLLANGRLYAGLGTAGLVAHNEKQNQGLLWSCDPDTANACATLDAYGNTRANVLVAGGGYLWAGLENGIVWRCDPDTANSCDTWEQAGGPIESLSYNGQGTLYAAVGDKGVIWSCPIATPNSCSNLVTKVDGVSVAAGPDGVFSSVDTSQNAQTLRYGTSSYSAYALGSSPQLVYIPAGGPVGVGRAKVEVGAVSLPAKLDRRCRSGGKGPRVEVTARGPYGMTRSQQVGLCALRGGATVERTFSLLDPGSYVVTARTKQGAYVGHGTLTVEPDATENVEVLLAPRKPTA